jgi:hypothetical protein
MTVILGHKIVPFPAIRNHIAARHNPVGYELFQNIAGKVWHHMQLPAAKFMALFFKS